MFFDRKQAAGKLAAALSEYRKQGAVVLGIHNGGAEIAYYVAKLIQADLSFVVTRPLSEPTALHRSFGVIAEDGSTFISKHTAKKISKKKRLAIISHEKLELERSLKELRQGEPLPNMAGRTVIITDDGLDTRATLVAVIKLCRKKDVQKIIVAVPVAKRKIERSIARLVDRIIVLDEQEFLCDISQAYIHYDHLMDHEGFSLFSKWRHGKSDHTGQGTTNLNVTGEGSFKILENFIHKLRV